MRVTIEGFGVLRQQLCAAAPPCSCGERPTSPGVGRAVELQAGATVRDLVRTLALADGLVAMATVNGTVRPLDHPLADRDEVKLIPPVSGG
ncbi:MAG: MoaD/ThiS family protein [Planctomycetota bacterium]|nr:MoaD/ThiS family protein [Planctomycetota bacterium]